MSGRRRKIKWRFGVVGSSLLQNRLLLLRPSPGHEIIVWINLVFLHYQRKFFLIKNIKTARKYNTNINLICKYSTSVEIQINISRSGTVYCFVVKILYSLKYFIVLVCPTSWSEIATRNYRKILFFSEVKSKTST